MNDDKIIGGEFDIDINQLVYDKGKGTSLEETAKYSSGRSALYHILKDVERRFSVQSILLPDYLCSSIVKAVETANFNYGFYQLNNLFELSEEDFKVRYNEHTAVLIINYFGLQDLTPQIAFVRSINPDAIIIVDEVQAYYEFTKPLGDEQYAFTSLRKTFAVPDGGLVKSIYDLEEPTKQNTFYQYKLGGSLLKSFRKPEYYDDDLYLSLFEKGEDMIDAQIGTGMSGVSKTIKEKVDENRISLMRKRNAGIMLSGLQEIGIEPLLPVYEENVPLFIPIYLKDRNKVRRRLFENNIFCPVHWPLDGLPLEKGREMAEHELSIIIDQRYTKSDMLRILDVIEKTQ